MLRTPTALEGEWGGWPRQLAWWWAINGLGGGIDGSMARSTAWVARDARTTTMGSRFRLGLQCWKA